jgi:hypothetical protein
MSLSELKSALRKLTVTWTGYGSGDNAGVKTYGANLKVWYNNTWNSWGTNTVSTPSLISANSGALSGNVPYLTNDQKLYFLVHSTYPASATNQSEIYTDYINLIVELADYVDYVPALPVKVRKETKEAKLAYPMKSNRFGDNGHMELTYKYIPYQGAPTNLGNLLQLPSVVLATSEGTGKAIGTSRLEIGNPISQLPLPSNTAISNYIRDPLNYGSQYGNPSAFYPFVVSGAFDVSKMMNPFGYYRQTTAGIESFSVPVPPKYTGGKTPTAILVVVPQLFVLNTGEIILRISVSTLSNVTYLDSGFVSIGGTVTYADFSLQGKPLVKGVN